MMTVGTPRKTIGREVVYMKGVDQHMKKNGRTMLALVGILVAVYVAGITGGFQWGYGVEHQVVQAQDRVIQEYRTQTDLQSIIITAKTSQVASLSVALKASQATVKAMKKRKVPAPAPQNTNPVKPGWRVVQASWYGRECFGGHTASGADYNAKTWCVAHKTLPLGTVIELRYDGHTVKVPVLDRGPFVAGRELDLSYAVAKSLGFSGVHNVSYRIVKRGKR